LFWFCVLLRGTPDVVFGNPCPVRMVPRRFPSVSLGKATLRFCRQKGVHRGALQGEAARTYSVSLLACMAYNIPKDLRRWLLWRGFSS